MSRRRAPLVVEFNRFVPDALVEAIAVRVAAGTGWINVRPSDDGVDHRALGRPSFFAARGPTIPLGTFVVGTGSAPHQLGLEHAGGRGALAQLRKAGVTLPPGTTLVQDHPRRGLIFSLPYDTQPAATATLLVEAAVQLTPIPLPQRWFAEIYER
ncbi:MAG: hypothetical protein ACKV2O_13835 [Acidimicrobiales bacterium]